MKISTRGSVDFHTSEVDAQQSYRIANSVHMMKILSDSLYSDKIGAVVRELSTNAYDSHVAAGKATTPFHVSLPTLDNLVFEIRDFGTGMSKDQIMQMYTVYGRSDKSHSDEFVGCFGLGSKSPFAYTSSFTTVSYYNGTAYTFINAINDRGVPVCNLVDTRETTQPNGLRISIPVEANDINKFKSAARSIYQWFDTPPEIKEANKPIVIASSINILENREWVYNGNYRTCVIMGQIAYPINNVSLDKKYNIFSLQGLIIKANVGDVDMDASRENLQYNQKTLTFLDKMAKTIMREQLGIIQKEVDGCTNRWDAYLKFKELETTTFLSVLNRHTDIFKLVTYRGVSIDLHQFVSSDQFVSFQSNRQYNRQNTIRRGKPGTTNEILPRSNIYFVVNDCANKGYAACSELASQNKQNKYFLYCPSHIENETITERKNRCEDRIATICKMFSCDASRVIKTSECPTRCIQPRAARPKKSPHVIKYFRQSQIGSKLISDSIDLDKSAGYYIIKKADSTDNELSYTIKIATNVIEGGNSIIIIINDTDVDKIKKYSDWIELSEYVVNKLDRFYLDQEQVRKNMLASCSGLYSKYKKLYDLINKDTCLYKILTEIKSVSTTEKKDYNHDLDLYKRLFDKEYPNKVVNNKYEDTKEQIDEVYPMLHFISYYDLQDNDKFKKVVKYINSVGKTELSLVSL